MINNKCFQACRTLAALLVCGRFSVKLMRFRTKISTSMITSLKSEFYTKAAADFSSAAAFLIFKCQLRPASITEIENGEKSWSTMGTDDHAQARNGDLPHVGKICQNQVADIFCVLPAVRL